jgi:dimethylamine/trimethylamine dehydrogenase
VRDYREQQLLKMTNVEVFFESALSAEDVFEIGADHVAIATGARWRRDRFDGKTYVPVATNGAEVLTPDDIMDGRLPAQGPVIVFDTDNYYMGGVIAEKLAAEGLDVTYVTESDSVSEWAGNTSERWRIRTRLMERGIRLVLAHSLTRFDGTQAELVCEYSDAAQHMPATAVVLVTQRAPCNALYHAIIAHAAETALPFTLTRIGDCEAPAIIAAAVHAGHRYATELETAVDRDEPLRHDRPIIATPTPSQAA